MNAEHFPLGCLGTRNELKSFELRLMRIALRVVLNPNCTYFYPPAFNRYNCLRFVYLICTKHSTWKAFICRLVKEIVNMYDPCPWSVVPDSSPSVFFR